MFHITAATTNSLSFSWQEPAIPNGVVTGYELSCQPLRLGISVPQQLNPGPTDQMSVLGNLQPGVTYNCSIRASNGAGHSVLVYADGTTMETGVVHYCVLCMSISHSHTISISQLPMVHLRVS